MIRKVIGADKGAVERLKEKAKKFISEGEAKNESA